MILNTMNNSEIYKEITTDCQIILTRSIDRYFNMYDKLRRKNSVPKDSEFPISYELKTHAKNNWIIILSKAPSITKYKGSESICFCLLVYYYTTIGIRVFKVDFKYGIRAFNAHFFTRYNERMNLGLINPIDKVKHYFCHNSYSFEQLLQNNSGFNVIGKCKDGFRLGSYSENQPWIIYKTFISNSMTTEEQDEIGKDLMITLQKQIELELVKEDFDRDKYDYMADVFKGIAPNNSAA